MKKLLILLLLLLTPTVFAINIVLDKVVVEWLTEAERVNFLGQQGQLAWVTDRSTLVAFDGTTQGGIIQNRGTAFGSFTAGRIADFGLEIDDANGDILVATVATAKQYYTDNSSEMLFPWEMPFIYLDPTVYNCTNQVVIDFPVHFVGNSPVTSTKNTAVTATLPQAFITGTESLLVKDTSFTIFDSMWVHDLSFTNSTGTVLADSYLSGTVDTLGGGSPEIHLTRCGLGTYATSGVDFFDGETIEVHAQNTGFGTAVTTIGTFTNSEFENCDFEIGISVSGSVVFENCDFNGNTITGADANTVLKWCDGVDTAVTNSGATIIYSIDENGNAIPNM